jgi:hypothetical protein
MQILREPGIGVFINFGETSYLLGYRLVEIGPIVIPWPSVMRGRRVG